MSIDSHAFKDKKGARPESRPNQERWLDERETLNLAVSRKQLY